MFQTNLFGEINEDEEIIQKYNIDKYHKRGTKIFDKTVKHYKYVEEHNKKCQQNNDENDETFEELEKRIAKKGRRHIGYPCDIAQDMPREQRINHIKNCQDCEKLLEDLEKKVGIR